MANDRNWGGARAGAGRPKKAVVRKKRSTTAFDHEWEIILDYAKILKKDFDLGKKHYENLRKEYEKQSEE